MMISSVVPPLNGALTPTNSSSATASAVATVKSSAKGNKRRMNLTLLPEHKKMFDAVRSEFGSLGVDIHEFHWGQFSFVKF